MTVARTADPRVTYAEHLERQTARLREAAARPPPAPSLDAQALTEAGRLESRAKAARELPPCPAGNDWHPWLAHDGRPCPAKVRTENYAQLGPMLAQPQSCTAENDHLRWDVFVFDSIHRVITSPEAVRQREELIAAPTGGRRPILIGRAEHRPRPTDDDE